MSRENNVASKCQIWNKLNGVVRKVKDRDWQRIGGKSKTVDFGPRAYGFPNKSATGAGSRANRIGGARAEKFGATISSYIGRSNRYDATS